MFLSVTGGESPTPARAGNTARVRFMRLAQVQLAYGQDEPWTWGSSDDPVEVNSQRIGVSVKPFRVLVMAKHELATPLSLNEGNRIVIPDEVSRACERAIEAFADVTAISRSGERSVSSPVPEAGFCDVLAEERHWLDSTSGFALKQSHRSPVSWHLSVNGAAIDALDDRPDGVSLLAEALACKQELGRFREPLRVFERGFALGPFDLIGPVSEFLTYVDVLGYSQEEVDHWFRVLRHLATHADRREDFALARDVMPVLNRVEFAAYDVLLNKRDWRGRGKERRHVWLPDSAPMRDGLPAKYRIHTRARVDIAWLDGFGAYLQDLDLRLQELGGFPDDWWLGPDRGENLQQPGSFEVVQSFRTGGEDPVSPDRGG
jgi:hypothetical protein